ncbi:MAG: DUF397 domain-containing protein [Kineosporiaceae bacterium]|nr:DUF397 domain-containing protein [Kineosporiaceae bacterium]
MPAMVNGTPGGALTHLAWTKSRRSGPTGNCVELARLPQGCGIGVRNSRDPLGPVLIYTDAEIEALILGVKDGDFDHLLAQPTAG